MVGWLLKCYILRIRTWMNYLNAIFYWWYVLCECGLDVGIDPRYIEWVVVVVIVIGTCVCIEIYSCCC